jgi:dTDP-4-amino-4,6-dideoxygalactose transaminase
MGAALTSEAGRAVSRAPGVRSGGRSGGRGAVVGSILPHAAQSETLAILGRIERMKAVLRDERIAIGDSIEARRRQVAGLSQRRLAGLAGVQNSLYWRIVHGREWAPLNIQRVDAALRELGV